ncbi:MAG: hypothetical protein U0354_19320 [Candidatus Sericytochromatia bacterium]
MISQMINETDLRSKFNELNKSKLTIKANNFKERIADEKTLELKVLIEDKSNSEEIKLKANDFKERISDTKTLEIKTLVSDKSSELPTKLKADNFRDKLLFSESKNLKSSNIEVKQVKFDFTNEKDTNNEKTPDYIQVNIDKAKNDIKEDISTEKPKKTGQVINLSGEKLLSLTESLTAVEKASLLSKSGLKEIDQIIGKVVGGEPLNLSELNQLKKFSDLIIENSDKLGIKKEVFVELNKLITGVQVATEKYDIKKKEFMKNTEIVNQKLDSLVQIISDPSLKLDSNFVEMLQLLRQRYKGIIASGNPALIAMFSTYIDKVIKTVEDIKSGKQTDPTIFRKLHNDYDKFVDTLFKYLSENKVPSKDEIKQYMGELADSFIDMLNNDFLPDVKTDNKNNNSSYLSNMKDMMKMTSNEISSMSKVSLSSVRKAMENDKVFQAMSDMSNSIKSLKISFDELNQARKELEEANKKLISFISSKEFKAELSKVSNGNDLLSRVISDAVRESIEKAEELEDLLNLEIDTNDIPTIVDLLQKFRDIISKLDVDLKKIQQEEEASKNIDKNYLNSVKENKDRQEKLDERKADALKASLKANKEKFAIR